MSKKEREYISRLRARVAILEERSKHGTKSRAESLMELHALQWAIGKIESFDRMKP